MYWANQMQWTADCSETKHSAEFVRHCLQSWIPPYQWKNVNPSLASLGQLMAIKKNATIVEEVVSCPQYIFIKEKVIRMLKMYQKTKISNEFDNDEEEVVEEEKLHVEEQTEV